jgi:hypothetical protein
MELMASTPTNNTNRPIPHNNPSTITIWQQNMNRSGTCQHGLISSVALARQGINIVALQEPAINGFGTMITSRDWIQVYPSTHGRDPYKTRSLFLIHSNTLMEQWKQIDFPSGDVTVIQLNRNWGATCIFNIHNNCKKNNTIHQLEALTHSKLNLNNDHPNNNETSTRTLMWLGDFNCHHLHWDNPSDTRLFTRTALNDAETLISAVAEARLDLALPPGIPMHLHNITKYWTRLDQVFISEEAMEAIITCNTLLLISTECT